MTKLQRPRKRHAYYKVQLYDELSLSWIDEHLSFSSLESAREYILQKASTRKGRIMKVSGRSRCVMPDP